MDKSLIHKASHYNQGTVEVIKVIWDWGLSFCLGNCLKYIARAEHKGTKLQDLKKSREYISMEIDYRLGLLNEKGFKAWLRKFITKHTRKLFAPHIYNPRFIIEDWDIKGNLRTVVCCLATVDLCNDSIEMLKGIHLFLGMAIEDVCVEMEETECQ